MPRPKWYCQMRFTMTRGVSGFFGSASQLASTERRPVEFKPSGGAIFESLGSRIGKESRLHFFSLDVPVAGSQDVGFRSDPRCDR